MDASQPPAAPVPLTAPSPGSSIEEDDDLYVSPKTSPRPSYEVPPPSSTMATFNHSQFSYEPSYSPGGLSDYNTWSAAMADSPIDPTGRQARKASDTSNTSSKRSLPPTPGRAAAEAARAGPTSEVSSDATASTATGRERKNSLQPTLSQRYQQLKERSAAEAARRASLSSDGHTFTTSWERRGSELSDSSGLGYGRLPALEDVQHQNHRQRRVVSSPEPTQSFHSAHPGVSHPPSAFATHDPQPQPPSSFPGRERQGSLPPIPVTTDISPRSSNRRDSLPPIPGESPTRRMSGALPPIPSEHAGSTPASPTKRNALENGNGSSAIKDFIPYASVYGGVDGEDREGSNPGSRRNTLPPLPTSPDPRDTKEQTSAQLYAQQQMAQQRREREQRDREHVTRQQQHPPRNSVYENEKDVPPAPAPATAAAPAYRPPPPGPPPAGPPPSGPPPTSFAAPHPQPSQSLSLPTRRSTLPHAPDNYASQQQAMSRESHSTLRHRSSQAQQADARSPHSAATPQASQGSTPQRTRPVHPEFQHGDLTIQVSRPQDMDFQCSYTVLTTASALIASTLAQYPPGKSPRVQISETVPEARLLLSALNFGNISHSSLAVVERDPLSVAEYLTLLRLYRKYQVSAFFTDLLQYQINHRAVELSHAVMRRDKGLSLDAVRLAVEAKSPRLWDMLNKYSQHWFEMLLPIRLTQEDKDRLGKTGLEVLVAWNALRLGTGDRPDGVKVGYEGDRIIMWRTKDNSRKFFPCT